MKLQHILMAVTALAAAGLSQAQPADPLQVRSWAAACAACHGTQGHAQPGMIALAGTPQEVIVQKMLDFKAGRLPAATVMHQLAKGYSDEQITAIAGYFAAQKK
ncbi:class I cytochrome c [Limnohabitans sp. T6-20]|uniref:c-type cytochrome n=1 Tax=Limnohabitans sp. T6-20 TaxID=1100725 RepID=UPI000D3C31E1|nr:class I cytochrome c [Limnohabitans sp. T6-20]PUE13076.1 class I cytochrome c [Limnohabitans sp. T6-20]